MISILKSVVVIGEGSFKPGILLRHPPLSSFDIASCDKKGVWKLDVPFAVHPLKVVLFVFLDTSPSILFLVFSPFFGAMVYL